MYIKVYYQKMIGGAACIYDELYMLDEALTTEIDELYYNDKIEEEKSAIRDNILHSIKSLKVGEKIEALGFEWGLKEMHIDELDALEEFTGW